MQLKNVPKNLPDSPGVYFFKKSGLHTPLYIGKATSLKDRVKSYFSKDLAETRGPHMAHMLKEAHTVTFQKTDSVLEALLCEASLIKKWLPPYNVKEKDDKSFNYVCITKESFPQILIVRGRDLAIGDSELYAHTFGPFPKGSELKEALGIIRRIFPWRDRKCVLGTERPCFNRQIGLCPGTCTGEISAGEYKNTIRHIALLFLGKKKVLIRSLERDMKKHARAREFEKAGELRNKIFSLKHIQDIALLKRESRTGGMRIEAYDIAHLSGSETVGVMVVMDGGVLRKDEYRKFKIKSGRGNDDVGNLKEVLGRRFRHKEWKLPSIIVVDGGAGQVRATQNILDAHNLDIALVGVVKDEHHKPGRFISPQKIIEKEKRNIIRINSEAHRFAIGYHRMRRSISFKSKF